MPQLPPAIESFLFIPGSIGGTNPSILAPGGRIYLKGRAFGRQKGRVKLVVNGSHFPDYPGGWIPLENVKWESHEKVNARIPSGMKGPIFRSDVQIVLTREDGKPSAPRAAQFEVPVETRLLKPYDPEVKLIACAQHGTLNSCGTSVGVTLSGFHLNSWAAPGGSPGIDDYMIELGHDHGWVFSRVARFWTEVTGDDVSRSTRLCRSAGRTGGASSRRRQPPTTV